MSERIVHRDNGFSLIEVLLLIIVTGILASVAVQSLTSSIDDSRRVVTEREMEILSKAIVGDPSIMQDGRRSDFGYIGDIGDFPPDLQALIQNPGLGTWKGPYLEHGFIQDSTGFKTDEWGQLYAYIGGMTITSTGSGSTITKKLANSSDDYLLNSFNGLIRDSENNPPGAEFMDSVDVIVTVPDGSGSTIDKACHPDRFGMFSLDSLPVGTHPLRMIYTPMVDTLLTYLTVLPRHKSENKYKFSSNYFADTSGTGGGAPLAISLGESRTLGGLSFNDEDIIFYDRGEDTSSMLFDGSLIFAGSENVDAVHILADGKFIISTTTPASIGGVAFNEDDLVFYDPSADTAAIILYGDSLFSAPENINAVHLLDSAHVLLSTDNTASIGSLSFLSGDIVEYYIDDDSARLYFDGNAAFGGTADINAIHILGDGHIILSVSDAGRTIGSLTFGCEDLVEYDPISSTATMYFDGSEFFAQFPTNINAVHIGVGSGTLASYSSLDSGLVGHWPLDEDSGQVAHNSSVYSSDADLQNDALGDGWNTDGKINGCFEFDGSDDYFRTPANDTELQMTDEYSISVWIYADSVQENWAGICSKNTPSGNDNHWTLQFNNVSGQSKAITVYHPGGYKWTSTYTLADCKNEWHHLVVTYRNSPARVQLFVDGVIYSESTSLTAGPGNGSGKLHIGAERIEIPFKGKIDDVRVYNRILIPSEILALYNMGN